MDLIVRRLQLPLAERLDSGALDSGAHRELTVVELRHEDRVGWGECAALADGRYFPETSSSAFSALAKEDMSKLVARPMLAAALEMAELDLRLRAQEISLAHYLGVAREAVDAGAAVGLGPDQVASTRRAAAEGYRKVKLKSVGTTAEPFALARIVEAIRSSHPELILHADGNQTFSAGDIAQIRAAFDAGLDAFEQPFAIDDLDPAVALVEAGHVVLADEAATDHASVERLVSAGACRGIVVKPSRLGGLFAAFELLGWCEENGIDAMAGGMLESGLGRHALAVVAASSACTLPGDLSPARRWLADDPWDDVVMESGAIGVPNGAGVAPAPDRAVLDRYTVEAIERHFEAPTS